MGARFLSYDLPALNSLPAFEASARHCSFTKAADELHLTQAAISFQVRNLEKSLSVKLFVRKHRHLELTIEGVALLNAVQGAFEILSAQKKLITGRKTIKTVSISAPVSFCSKWLIPNLKNRKGDIAKIKLLIDASDEKVDIKSGEFDLAIRYTPSPPTSHESKILLRDKVFPVCSPQYFASVGGIISAEGIAEMTLLWDKMTDVSWRDWTTKAYKSDQKSKEGIHFSHTANAIDAAIAGQGLALGRLALVFDDLQSDRLIRVLDEVVASDYCYYILRSKNSRRNREIDQVVSWLLDTAAKPDFPDS